MNSDKKRRRIGYKIILPLALLILGLVLGLILAVVGFEANPKKMGGGIGVLLLLAVVVGILADMKKQKADRD